jgi:hypothetical protein
VTYDTGLPPGTPDFAQPYGQPGIQIDKETIGPTNTQVFGTPFYVGNTYAMTFYAAITCTQGWALRVNWSLVNGTGSLVTPIENYTGFGNCVVVNTIPVLAPWCVFEVFSGDVTPTSAAIEVYTAAANSRGAVTRYLNALCIDQQGVAVAGGTSADFYGTYLTPGQYQYYLQVADAWTGQAYFQAASDGSIAGRLSGVQNLNINGTFAGQLIVGNMQPSLHITNTGGGASHFTASLIGPA